MFDYRQTARDPHTHARAGTFSTPHGTLDLPAFMPVGTRGSVRGVTPAQLRECGVQIILANTYHLALRPGADVVAGLGGLHRFMAWDGPILTDSGGFQVFSLADLRRVDDAGVTFRSHIDGRTIRLDPAGAIEMQNLLGADIIMALDQCVRLPAAPDELRRAVARTIGWAEASRRAHHRADQALFGIVQGGLDMDLRMACVDALGRLDFPGYAVGGLAVGEPPEEMFRLLGAFVPLLPADRPRYLMGVGRPVDIVRAVACGIDLFDCVMPTRNGRNGCAFTDAGAVRLRNEAHKGAAGPLDETCDCATCRRFSRGYLRYLFIAGEMLGPILVSLHNIAYYQRLLARVRAAVLCGQLKALLGEFEVRAAPADAEEYQWGR